jgi:hypothetical protein
MASVHLSYTTITVRNSIDDGLVSLCGQVPHYLRNPDGSSWELDRLALEDVPLEEDSQAALCCFHRLDMWGTQIAWRGAHFVQYGLFVLDDGVLQPEPFAHETLVAE